MSEALGETDLALRVPLEGVQLIEASAGTGKTYTIAGLYVRLLVEQALEVDRILVMTFTKAATEELRQRLRQRLRRCARLARAPWVAGDDPPPADADHETRWSAALLRDALQRGGETADALARRLERALTRMDEAAIFTIHGFCQRVIGEHAALIDGVDAAAVLEPSDDDLLEIYAADAWLRLGEGEDAVRRDALRAFGATPRDLARTLKSLVAFDGRIEPMPGPDGDTRGRAGCRGGPPVARRHLGRAGRGGDRGLPAGVRGRPSQPQKLQRRQSGATRAVAAPVG